MNEVPTLFNFFSPQYPFHLALGKSYIPNHPPAPKDSKWGHLNVMGTSKGTPSSCKWVASFQVHN